jgi:hypothetical protein
MKKIKTSDLSVNVHPIYVSNDAKPLNEVNNDQENLDTNNDKQNVFVFTSLELTCYTASFASVCICDSDNVCAETVKNCDPTISEGDICCALTQADVCVLESQLCVSDNYCIATEETNCNC